MFLKQLWTREEAADVNILSSELGSSNVLPSRPHVRALKTDSLPFCHSRRKQYLPVLVNIHLKANVVETSFTGSMWFEG
jgi:hypothetical protein